MIAFETIAKIIVFIALVVVSLNFKSSIDNASVSNEYAVLTGAQFTTNTVIKASRDDSSISIVPPSKNISNQIHGYTNNTFYVENVSEYSFAAAYEDPKCLSSRNDVLHVTNDYEIAWKPYSSLESKNVGKIFSFTFNGRCVCIAVDPMRKHINYNVMGWYVDQGCFDWPRLTMDNTSVVPTGRSSMRHGCVFFWKNMFNKDIYIKKFPLSDDLTRGPMLYIGRKDDEIIFHFYVLK